MFRRFLPALLCVSLAVCASDLKFTKKTKDAGGEHGDITYFHQGLRTRIDHRSEFGYGWKDGHPETVAFGPRMSTIYQCDMHRILELDFDHHQYTVTEVDRSGVPENAQVPPARSSGAKVRIVVETRDTGETKQVFGQTARRFVTTRRIQPSAGACATAQESVEDGWYVDLESPQEGCAQTPASSGVRRGRDLAVLVAATCTDDFEVLQSGPTLPPFPVELTVTARGNGQKSTTETVTQLSRLPLDPQIFDLPTGYKHVESLDNSPNLPWLLRGRLMWQSVKSTVWGWTPWGR